jgi:hypothetical protein
VLLLALLAAVGRQVRALWCTRAGRYLAFVPVFMLVACPADRPAPIGCGLSSDHRRKVIVDMAVAAKIVALRSTQGLFHEDCLRNQP